MLCSFPYGLYHRKGRVCQQSVEPCSEARIYPPPAENFSVRDGRLVKVDHHPDPSTVGELFAPRDPYVLFAHRSEGVSHQFDARVRSRLYSQPSAARAHRTSCKPLTWKALIPSERAAVTLGNESSKNAT